MKRRKVPVRVIEVTTELNGGCAGWHATVETTDVKIDRAGEFKAIASDTLEAELKAAAVGLTIAKQAFGGADDRPILLLQLSSAEAIGVILASDCRYEYSAGPYRRDQVVVRASHVPARAIAAVAAIRKVRDETGVGVYLRLLEPKRAAA